jgi:hypothetical protein
MDTASADWFMLAGFQFLWAKRVVADGTAAPRPTLGYRSRHLSQVFSAGRAE